jgi:hypothetical protein
LLANATVQNDNIVQARPIPYASEVPYALFQYAEFIDGGTGSAAFNAEAIWMGGLPMTYSYGINPQTGAAELDRNITCANSNDYNLAGWRYCVEEGDPRDPDVRIASDPWVNHTALTRYYGSDANVVLDENGMEVADFELFDPVDLEIRDEVTQVGGNLFQQGFPMLDNDPVPFFDRFINPDSQNEHTVDRITDIKTGDYLFILRGNTLGHGFLIVGWGEIMSCPSALGTIWSFETPIQSYEGQIYMRYTDRPPNLPVVPYIVDFSGGIDSSQLQLPQPRPFYCSQYENPQNFQNNLFDSWRFYTFIHQGTTSLQDQVTTPTSHIYVSQEWEWE